MYINPIGLYDSKPNWGCCSVNTDIFASINGSIRSTDVFGAILNSKPSYTMEDQVSNDPAWINVYLQYPNEQIKELAEKIVNKGDSDDLKMRKIQYWVVNNIKYQTDSEQYGFDELWVPPIMTLKSGKGDCEDGAFLIMSLALNAGVEASKLRMYGGFVDAGEGAASGGHGWVAYKRESDNEWVAVDFSYYPDLRPMDDRIPLRKDEKYKEDYFFMTNQYFVLTEHSNHIRNPKPVYTSNAILPTVLTPVGSMISLWG